MELVGSLRVIAVSQATGLARCFISHPKKLLIWSQFELLV